MQQQTLKVFYTSEVINELDIRINTFVTEYLKQNFGIDSNLSYSEFTEITPKYRLIVFELSKELNESEKATLTNELIKEFNSSVKVQ